MFIGCSSCPSNNCNLPGKAFVELSSVDITINLGKVEGGASAGDIHIRSDVPSPALATPAGIDVYSLQAVEIIRDDQGLRQLLAEQTLVDIVVIDDFSYEMKFYKTSDVLADKTKCYSGKKFPSLLYENDERTVIIYEGDVALIP